MAPDTPTGHAPAPTSSEVGLSRRLRVSLWVVAITARSAVDAFRTRNATHP
ncbi:hypothetical protein MU582_20795 [Nocardioidaceae bacterium SCSIO 66511]|nr:hypothetical protein MU582_20795 [Nocardioidaceae bacterium SCSIO 66511]